MWETCFPIFLFTIRFFYFLLNFLLKLQRLFFLEGKRTLIVCFLSDSGLAKGQRGRGFGKGFSREDEDDFGAGGDGFSQIAALLRGAAEVFWELTESD